MIVRDEADKIERALESCWSAIDEAVIVDTGSRDDTVAKIRAFAERKRGTSKLKLAEFAWSDDFAAARNFADKLATGEWLVWLDADDEVEGLAKLREYAGNAADEVVAFFTIYDYARDEHGNCLSELWRERVVRNDGTRWSGRLHEHKLFTSGTVVKVDPGDARWVHRRVHDRDGENARNLRILKRWLADEPDNPRVLSSLGLEYVGAGKHAEAAETFERYLACPGEPADRRCQAARYRSVMLLQQGSADAARAQALEALSWDWTWADTHLSLAECAQTAGRPQEGYLHAKQALELGKPQSLLILNPLQYTAHPRALMAVCLAQLGKLDEAVRLAEETLEICPSYGLIAANIELWRGALQRERAVGAFSACAQLLADCGEGAKALRVLDAVPATVSDDARIIDARAQVRRRLRQVTPAPLDPDSAAAKFVVRQLSEAA